MTEFLDQTPPDAAVKSAPVLIQCVPNFSEGRDTVVLERIASSISALRGVRLLDWSSDPDHNRSVFTFLGGESSVSKAAVAAATTAVMQIDVSRHDGVHPRLGALDVLPFVPLKGISLEQCAALALSVGNTIAETLNVPVFFYEAASSQSHTLPFIRKHAFRDLLPDAGGNEPHPTAGAVVVGARLPLVAFNVNLANDDVERAKTISRGLRSAFPGQVRALGLRLHSQGRAQVSTNIVRTDLVHPLMVLEFVSRHADVHSTELIGTMPGHNAFEVLQHCMHMPTIRAGQVLLETWPVSVVDNGSQS